MRRARRALPAQLAAGVLLVGSAGAAPRSDVTTGSAVAPELTVHCDVDICITELSYVLPVRRDGHPVTFRWETRPAPGYPDNAADTVTTTWPSGVGEPLPEGRGYRYTVSEFVWHSDIRCDDAVTVTARADGTAPQTFTASKDVPASPVGAYCSAYGIQEAGR